MGQAESKIEAPVKKWARQNGLLVIKLVSWQTESGWPDDLFLFGGAVAFIEFKAPGKVPSTIQAYRIQQLTERGYRVGVIDNVDQGKQFLRDSFRDLKA